jgi:hypothetical protein
MHYSPSGELIYDDFTVMQYEHLDSEAPCREQNI